MEGPPCYNGLALVGGSAGASLCPSGLCRGQAGYLYASLIIRQSSGLFWSFLICSRGSLSLQIAYCFQRYVWHVLFLVCSVFTIYSSLHSSTYIFVILPALVTIASSGRGFYLCAAMALSACSLVGHPYGVIAWCPVLACVHSMCQYPLISTGRPGISSAYSLRGLGLYSIFFPSRPVARPVALCGACVSWCLSVISDCILSIADISDCVNTFF